MGYRRSRQERKRLAKLYKETKYSCRGGAWYDDEKGRFIRYYASNTPRLTKGLRRISNKKVRKIGYVLNHGLYKRAYDYWWSLF